MKSSSTFNSGLTELVELQHGPHSIDADGFGNGPSQQSPVPSGVLPAQWDTILIDLQVFGISFEVNMRQVLTVRDESDDKERRLLSPVFGHG